MKKTVLYQRHVEAGARMVAFGGWLMPVQYSSVLKEHSAVRKNAGLFDVSHMGEIIISGIGAADFTNRLVTNNVSGLKTGRALYSVMCDENGGILDDLLIYRLDENEFLLVPNASNVEKVLHWINSNKPAGDVTVKDVSGYFTLLALQGPKTVAIFKRIAGLPDKFPYYTFYKTTLGGANLIVSRTGYTGEDGLEIFAPPEKTVWLWDKLMDAGKNEGLLPAGLAARDLLRIEAGYSLYGHELDEDIDPFAAGLSWVVKMNASDFLGKAALGKLKPLKKKIGIRMEGKGIPRQGYPIMVNGKKAGEVTSGTFSPVLQKPIGIGYIALNGNGDIKSAGEGVKIHVEIRGKQVAATVCRLPFVKPGTVNRR